MRYALIFALVLGAGGAAAQDLRYSDDATAACVAQAANGAEKSACIGRSASACINATPDGQTTYGMGGCLDRELTYWDAVLNANYRNARARAKAVDVEMRNLGSSVPSLETSLRDMQRAWIGFRDATCDFERIQWGGGTGGGPATLACLMRLTGQQALYLEDAWIAD